MAAPTAHPLGRYGRGGFVFMELLIGPKRRACALDPDAAKEFLEPGTELRVHQCKLDVGLEEAFLAPAVVALAFVAVGEHLFAS